MTLDRPERHNAWTGRMHAELRHVFAEADDDRTVRVVVVTGAGASFCPGADFAALDAHVERGGYDPGTPDDMAQPGSSGFDEFGEDFTWLLGLRVVTIAAMNGTAAGVGLALACYCDLRFAVPEAKLTTAHGRLNLPAEYGLSWLLPRLIGIPDAMDLLLSSRVFTTDEAASMGLVNRIVSDEPVLEASVAYAGMLVETVSPNSLATTKRQVWLDQLSDDPGQSVRSANELLRTMTAEPDYTEGLAALRAKRRPRWRSEQPLSEDSG